MSCLSLPKSEAGCEELFEPEEVGWPAIVQGIRVYAGHQPPRTACELLEWADLFDAIGNIQDEDRPGGSALDTLQT